ncbi:MFS transporter [Brevundimonas sp. LM2]|uniref:MFS transporter n=1 Tax=Brevundimonas sp. LM2 TaxID=1938605 RepID=UPI000983E094|nr:MFS transporter [Brevundimonas sp. LM2]AQR62096.1 MFS transporter [Brevundimonas sp. LM2]
MTDAPPAPAPGRRSNRVLAAFSAPGLPYSAIGLPLAVSLPAFYSQYVGLDLAAVGTAFLLVRCLDICFDPVVGWGMDRTKSKWGPYRTWMAAGTPILMLAVGFIFYVQPGAGFGYLFVWLLVLYVGFSITTLAQLAWGAVLAPQYDERSRLYGWWQSANIVGVLIALFIPTIVLQAGWGTYEDGVRAMGLFILISLPVTLLVAVLIAPEPQVARGETHGALKAWIALFARPVVRKVLWCDLFLGIAPGITGALLFFYFESIKGFDRGQSQIFMVLYFVAGLMAAPFWSWLAVRVGKDRALQIASIAFAALYALIGFLPAGNFTVTAIGLFIAGLPYAAGLLLSRAMMADVADEVRLETGEDRMGLLFSFLSLTTKLGYAISVGVLILLAWVGFDQAPGAANSPTALTTLTLLFLALPTGLLVLSAVVLRAYPLTAARHAQVRAGLAEKDTAP